MLIIIFVEICFILIYLYALLIRAVQLIACDCHSHLVTKAGSVISSKSSSRNCIALLLIEGSGSVRFKREEEINICIQQGWIKVTLKTFTMLYNISISSILEWFLKDHNIEDWSNGCWKFRFAIPEKITFNNQKLKIKLILNCNNMLLNSALVRIRNLFKNIKQFYWSKNFWMVLKNGTSYLQNVLICLERYSILNGT